MKIPIRTVLVKNTRTKYFPEISPDEVDETIKKALQIEDTPQRNDVSSRLEFASCELLNFKSPQIPVRKTRSCHSCGTPKIKAHNNQLSAPVTPTFSNTSLDNFVIQTPMMINALDSLQLSTGSCRGPDILDFLDDSSRDALDLDRHIRRHSEVVLTDNNVVDYLLDISEDITSNESKQHVVKNERRVNHRYKKTGPDGADLTFRRVTRRSYLHSKIMTQEEEESLKRLRKEQGQMKRKERLLQFSQESKGTRKSTRRRPQVRR